MTEAGTVPRKVIYSMNVSLDGFIADRDGDVDWGAPDDELMRVHIAQTRELAVYAIGRRLYENMRVWETPEQISENPLDLEFAEAWNAVPKVVFSATLASVPGIARLAGTDVASEIAKLKVEPGGGTVAVGGAGLAATVSELGLIDEYRLFVHPVVLGNGTPFFPPSKTRLPLNLIETRTFASRVTYSRYQRKTGPS